MGSKLRMVFVHDSQEWKSADKIYTLTKNKQLVQKKHTKENLIDDNDEIFHDVPEVTAKRLVSRDDFLKRRTRECEVDERIISAQSSFYNATVNYARMKNKKLIVVQQEYNVDKIEKEKIIH